MTKTSPRALATIHRRQQIANLYLQGWPQATIAQKLHVGQATVSRDLRRVQQEWRKSAIRDFDMQCAIELQKLDRLECEAWAAWERSQQPIQQARIKGNGTAQSADRVITNRNGDPRFLDVVHKCIASRRVLLGLDSPARVVHSQPITPQPPQLTIEERRARLLQLIDTMQKRMANGEIEPPTSAGDRILSDDATDS